MLNKNAYHFKNKNTYSPITLTNISSINLVFVFRCSSSPSNPVYPRCVDFSDLVFSLSSHRHSYIGVQTSWSCTSCRVSRTVLQIFTNSSGNWPLLYSFRSSSSTTQLFQFHYRHTTFSSQLKSKIGNILGKSEALRITLNIDDTPLTSRSHNHPSHSQTSRLLF